MCIQFYSIQSQVAIVASESSALLRIRELEQSAQRTHTTAVTTLTPGPYTGDTASPASDKSITSKSLGSSDEDLVLISSMMVDSSEFPRVTRLTASDSHPNAQSGSIEMKKVGGSASASSSRRAAVEQDPLQPHVKESDVAAEDIDLARSSSDKNKKVQSSDQLYYVNEVRVRSRLSWRDIERFTTGFTYLSLRICQIIPLTVNDLLTPLLNLLCSTCLLPHSCTLRWMS